MSPVDERPGKTNETDTVESDDLQSSVAGRYLLGKEIARGGMGLVCLATDLTLGREVALKVLQAKFGPASGAARRFADEARITARLQHPAIPPIHDLGSLPDGARPPTPVGLSPRLNRSARRWPTRTPAASFIGT
jgi:serine/threonine protein kinase